MSSSTFQESKVPVVFITGATGTQGLNLATLLRSPAINWTVRTTVRDPTSAAALRLASLGVNLTPGSWDDIPALTAGLQTCTHLFLNTIPSFTDPLLERRQTSQILSLAKSAGVKHVIFSSALGINHLSEMPLFTSTPGIKDSVMYHSLLSKAATEETVKSSGFQYWTILRGASFMENYLTPKVYMYGPEFVTKRIWKMACSPDDTLPLVDTVDIAKFALAAFRQPERFNGQEVSIAGDVLPIRDIAAKITRAVRNIEDAWESKAEAAQLAASTSGGGGTSASFFSAENLPGPIVGSGSWRIELKGKHIQYIPMTEEEIEGAKKTKNPYVLGQLAIREIGKFVSVEETKAWGVEVSTFEEFLEREVEAVRTTYCRA
ncbi:hypothetical protein QBC37DRAFT_424455 [Rhypophila decipiens]|uniref:NmrA-like domain-containing protein n=1 Tax=Rhypophila decipiens TaxID=261697 RepID=A0AAN6YAY3_9PEZI|nr:hypothetical protein QBC37DRAFT_424455 [Rhypophila decipiens]